MFQLLTVEHLEALPDLQWLIAGILPQPGFAVLYGEPGCGKSFVALSMALSIASGQNWLGRKVEKRAVLYIAAEGVLGFKFRLQAFRKRHHIEVESVRFSATALQVTNDDHVSEILRNLKEENFLPSLIVIDTLARVSVGKDENSAKDMGEIVNGLETLKRETGATVLVIHHTRKDGGAERGSSALRGAADVMICCEKRETLTGYGVELTCKKMKDDEPFKPIKVMLEVVPVSGTRSSLVLGETFEGGLNVSGFHQTQLLDLVETKFGETGASSGELEAAFVSAEYGSKSSFIRALKALKDAGRLVQRMVGKKNRYFVAGVSVKPVSNECQTPTQIGVMSPPSLGGDTDTKSGKE